MIKPTMMNRFTNNIFSNYAKDSGKLLVHVGTGVTVIGASAQVGMLLADRDIDGKTKKFLVNQEIITSGACIALYYSICESVRVGVNKLVESGKLLSKSAATFIAGLDKDKNSVDAHDWKKIFTKEELKKGISHNLENIENTAFYKNSKEALKKQIKESAKTSLDVFQNFKNGVSVLSVIVASVFAGNIAGPIIGNFLATLPAKKDAEQ